jgi:hypothetical protein
VAVLAAFVIASYPSLQPDQTQISAQLLLQISLQLADSSTPPASLPVFQVQSSAQGVNICWFSSLVLSLLAAMFGFFLKQWIRTYMRWTQITPKRDAIVERQFLYTRMWVLSYVVTALPILLESAVTLFLGGLIGFLWTIHRTVAIIMTVLIGISFGTIAAATFLPPFSRVWTYKSPLTALDPLGVAPLVKSVRALLERPGSRDPERDTSGSCVELDRLPLSSKVQQAQVRTTPAIVEALRDICCMTQLTNIWQHVLSLLIEHQQDSPHVTIHVCWSLLTHILGLTASDTSPATVGYRRLPQHLQEILLNYSFRALSLAHPLSGPDEREVWERVRLVTVGLSSESTVGRKRVESLMALISGCTDYSGETAAPLAQDHLRFVAGQLLRPESPLVSTWMDLEWTRSGMQSSYLLLVVPELSVDFADAEVFSERISDLYCRKWIRGQDSSDPANWDLLDLLLQLAFEAYQVAAYGTPCPQLFSLLVYNLSQSGYNRCKSKVMFIENKCSKFPRWNSWDASMQAASYLKAAGYSGQFPKRFARALGANSDASLCDLASRFKDYELECAEEDFYEDQEHVEHDWDEEDEKRHSTVWGS